MVENRAHQPHMPQPVVVILKLFAPRAAGIHLHLHQLFILVPQTSVVEVGL